MDEQYILKKSLTEWISQYPLLEKIISTKEVFWTNTKFLDYKKAIEKISLTENDVVDASERLQRFAPYIKSAFPETSIDNGIIESELKEINNMKKYLENFHQCKIDGKLLLKCDSHLKVSGSIKARGGIYEVLKHAEELAIEHDLLKINDNYSILDSEKFKNFFSKYSIAVGSTGNLGLSIGIISAKLGFRVSVHMSADAKKWKKDLLKSKGVEVIEYESDYSKAVEEGRKQSNENPMSYFIDNENSKDLFLGYAVAAYRLKEQLQNMNTTVDSEHPLFVYLPCGVGGGPGGVAFGLKLIYKDDVHIFFAEPTHSPCMLIGCMTGEHNRVSVQDFGIDNITAADGLAVGRASGFVGRTIENLLSGIYTVEDNMLFLLLTALADTENIHLEPSALAGMIGPCLLCNYDKAKMQNATHIVWATGGSMVPQDELDKYYNIGKKL